MSLEIRNLEVEIEGEKVVKDVSLEVPAGEVHALMGPNGSGKSTICESIMGVNAGEITSGKIIKDGEEVQSLEISERARKP